MRSMRASDIPKIIKISKDIGEFRVGLKDKGFWSKEQLTNWVRSRKDSLIVAEKNNEIIGFVMFAHHVPTGKVTFENAWVDQKLRESGIARKLVEEGIKDLRKKGATYLCGLAKKDNLASVKFLEKSKFMKGFDFSWLHRRI